MRVDLPSKPFFTGINSMASRLQGMRSGRLYLDVREQRLFVKQTPVHMGPTAFHVLSVLMDRHQQLVTKDDLIEAVWDGRAVTDAVITTAMREVRRAISDPAKNPEFIETVRGRGYRFIKPVEQATEPVSSVDEAPSDRENTKTTAPSHLAQPTPAAMHIFTLIITAAALAVLAVLIFIGFERGFAPTPAPQKQSPIEMQSTGSVLDSMSIAVLPFSLNGATDVQEQFAAGIHDDLLTRLSKISDLRVISRTSVMKYQGSDTQIPEIAQDLEVASVVEGSVQRLGDRAKITVKLIDGASDRLIWAETYDRNLITSNLFDTQAEITSEIATKLKVNLSAKEAVAIRRVPTRSLPAYEAYYRGKVMFETAPVDDWLELSIASFDKALVLDPDFVEALVAKARAQLAYFWYQGASRDWIDRADRTLRRAEAIAPDDPQVQIVRGYYHYWGFRNYEEAATLAQDALKTAPSMAQASELLAYVSRRQGDFNQTMSALEQAHTLDPLDLELVTERLETYAPLGFYNDADAMVQVATRLNPQSFDLANNEALMWRLRGNAGKAYAAMSRELMVPAYVQYARRADLALLTQDNALIDKAFDDWSLVADPPSGANRSFQILRAEALFNRGNKAAARELLTTYMAEQGDTVFEGIAWTPNGRIFPPDVPALMGDADKVRVIVADYEKTATTDFWQIQKHWTSIIESLTRVGETDDALTYMERYIATFGPQAFFRFTIEPAVAPLRDDPRYKAMADKAEAWRPPNRPAEWSPEPKQAP